MKKIERIVIDHTRRVRKEIMLKKFRQRSLVLARIREYNNTL